MNADLATFLEHFRPDGYVTFVGMVPDGSTAAETFNGSDPSQAAQWITVQNRARGVYFTVNPTPPGTRSKPTKVDITEIAAVWADIDPRDDADRPWVEERERLEALAEELHALDTPPSFIVDSGNGIQPVWMLGSRSRPARSTAGRPKACASRSRLRSAPRVRTTSTGCCAFQAPATSRTPRSARSAAAKRNPAFCARPGAATAGTNLSGWPRP